MNWKILVTSIVLMFSGISCLPTDEPTPEPNHTKTNVVQISQSTNININVQWFQDSSTYIWDDWKLK